MDSLILELRQAARALARRPVFTAVAAATLALGIGANAAIFTVLNAAIIRPLPYREPERLVRIYESNVSRGWPEFGASNPNFADFRSQSTSFEAMEAWQARGFNLTGQGDAEQIGGGAITPGLFSMLGSEPALGRPFRVEEAAPGAGGDVVIVTYGLWQERFGGDPGLLGRTLRLNGVERTVVGIMPESLDWFPNADLIVPLDLSADTRRGNHTLGLFGRLKPGVTLEEATAEMEGIAARLGEQYPESNSGWSVGLSTFDDWIVDQPFRRALGVLMAACACVLLIACANMAHLILTRAAGRRREIAVRAALGAGRWALLRQQLAECGLLSVAGGALGLLLASWGVDLLRALDPGTVPRLEEISIDVTVLAFTMALCVATTLIAGALPALVVGRSDPADTIKEEGRGSHGGGIGPRLRATLIAVEFALSIVLLIGAGLLVRSLLEVVRVEPGFVTDGVITARIVLPQDRYADNPQVAAFHRTLIERVREMPGIRGAASINIVPLSGGNTAQEITIEGLVTEPGGAAPSADWRVITPGYFDALRISLRAGRDFNDHDDADAPMSVIVSESMARRFWPEQDPLGKRVRFGGEGAPWFSVVGVAADVRYRGLEDTEARALVYLPAWQTPWNPMTLIARTDGDPASLLPALRAAVASIDRELPLAAIRSMDEMIETATGARRFYVTLLAIFSGVALLLAAVGLYGVVSYSVAQRRHEIGIRVALGARPADLVRMVVGQGARAVAAGMALGLVAAVALTRLFSSLLFGVTTTDPMTYLGVPALLAAVALVACWAPARRAARVDPMVALRYE